MSWGIILQILIFDIWGSCLFKALYITGKEVFSFKMISYMDATAGYAYTDMSVVDIRVHLTVGCIEVVFITKFLYSILVCILINYFSRKKLLCFKNR